MILRTNARIAGFMFLFYIVVGVVSMVLSGRTNSGGSTAARLASIAQHADLARVNVVLTLLQFVAAVALGVTLYALTRHTDRDLALLALSCLVSEGVITAISAVRAMGVLSIATSSIGASPADAAAANAIGALLLKSGGWTGLVAATCFALGSTLFSWLFVRARSIPVWLAWLGLFSSLLLVLLVPAQLAGFLTGPVTNFMWLPMLVFEVVLALWLLIKGVAPHTAVVQP